MCDSLQMATWKRVKVATAWIWRQDPITASAFQRDDGNSVYFRVKSVFCSHPVIFGCTGVCVVQNDGRCLSFGQV